jgi:uncharacterized protein (DUF58 family)
MPADVTARVPANVLSRAQPDVALTSRAVPPYVDARMFITPGAARLDLLDPLEVSRLGGLEVVTEGLVEGFLAGLHRSPRRGFSVEFAEHRMYQPGDELRYVDWKLLGRKDRLYVKQFEEETNLRAMVVLDASRSMAWSGAPEGRLTKFEYARRLAAALTLVLLRQRDATGLIVFDEAVRALLPPRVSRAHWMRVLATLAGAAPGGLTAAASALTGVVERLRRRGLVVLISDLLLDPSTTLHALKFLRHRGHAVLVLHLLDPAEIELEGPAEVRLEDPETSDAVVLRPRDWAEVYRRTVGDVVTRWRHDLRGDGIQYHPVRTDQPFGLALREALVRPGGFA